MTHALICLLRLLLGEGSAKIEEKEMRSEINFRERTGPSKLLINYQRIFPLQKPAHWPHAKMKTLQMMKWKEGEKKREKRLAEGRKRKTKKKAFIIAFRSSFLLSPCDCGS